LSGRQIGLLLPTAVDLGSVFALTWKILQWPISLAFVFIGFALIYQFAPNAGARSHGKRLPPGDYRRRWVSPGVIIAVLLWLLVSLGFRLYLHFFNSYGAWLALLRGQGIPGCQRPDRIAAEVLAACRQAGVAVRTAEGRIPGRTAAARGLANELAARVLAALIVLSDGESDEVILD